MTLALLTALVVADGWLTHALVKRGGRELNPLVRALIARVGLVPALVATRLVALGAALAADAIAVALVIVYALAVGWNIAQVLKR